MGGDETKARSILTLGLSDQQLAPSELHPRLAELRRSHMRSWGRWLAPKMAIMLLLQWSLVWLSVTTTPSATRAIPLLMAAVLTAPAILGGIAGRPWRWQTHLLAIGQMLLAGSLFPTGTASALLVVGSLALLSFYGEPVVLGLACATLIVERLIPGDSGFPPSWLHTSGQLALAPLFGLAVLGLRALEYRYALTQAELELSQANNQAGFSQLTLTRHQLEDILQQMQSAATEVAGATNTVRAAALDQDATVAEQAASSQQIMASAREIATTSQQLLATMSTVSQSASATALTARDGRRSLDELRKSVDEVVRSLLQSMQKVNVLYAHAKNVNLLVTAITKVASDTNMLSLNAAIQAERAGQAGLGFAVVATEIRELADQTALATLEIDQTVRSMQESALQALTELDRHSKEGELATHGVARLSSQLQEILEAVEEMSGQFAQVDQGMRQQNLGAQQISLGIEQLAQSTQGAAAGSREFQKVVEQLNRAVAGLRTRENAV